MSIRLEQFSIGEIVGSSECLVCDTNRDEDGNYIGDYIIRDPCDEVYVLGNCPQELHAFLIGVSHGRDMRTFAEFLGYISTVEYALVCDGFDLSEVQGSAERKERKRQEREQQRQQLRMEVADQVAAVCLGYAAAASREVGYLEDVQRALERGEKALVDGYALPTSTDFMDMNPEEMAVATRGAAAREAFEAMKKVILQKDEEPSKVEG